jgi:hypothetical protein
VGLGFRQVERWIGVSTRGGAKLMVDEKSGFGWPFT